MAKILANKHSSNQSRMIKLRRELEFCRETKIMLDSKYDEKIERELASLLKKLNKELIGLAYDACDKKEYAEAELQQSLQSYDVKAYMKHREINHGAAKKIFKAVKSGGSIDAILTERAEKMKAVAEQRRKFVDSLEEKREKFLQQAHKTDAAPYEAKKAELEKQYELKKAELEAKYGEKIAKEKASVDARIARIEARMAKLKSASTAEHKLPDDVLLRVRGLKMYFGGLRAVDDLDFDVKKGEIFGLIGPNGAGKTTVFNCITQFYKPTAGELLFVTKDNETISLTDYQVHDIILKGIARTFQNIEVVKEVTVLENLLIAATRYYTSNLFTQTLHLPLLSREEKMIRAKADKILKYMDLYAYRDRLAWGLPYGVLKRIEIARVLMCNPQLIVLDEPAAGLNESETNELAELINKIRKDFDCTILLVEHDMSLVMNICDHICAISFGKKLAYGTASEVQASKEVQEAYLGVGGE